MSATATLRPKKGRRTKEDSDKYLPSAKQAKYLAAYAKVGVGIRAAEVAGVDKNAHYYWMKHDPEYPAKFRAAHEEAVQVLEAEARRRAVEGWEEPVFYRGEECGVVRKYSDTLLIFTLKAARPDKYRERYDVKGNVDHNHKVHVYLPNKDRDPMDVIDVPLLTDGEEE